MVERKTDHTPMHVPAADKDFRIADDTENAGLADAEDRGSGAIDLQNWYAVYTKPKCEDYVANLLNNAGIETLSPKIKTVRYKNKKYTEIIEQLFPSYIFAFFDRERHSHMIRYTRGVRYVVGKENPVVVPPQIIDVIRERLEGDIVKPEPVDFHKGDRVLIKDGPFKDFYGIFERNISGKKRSMILLEVLNFKIDIESYSLKKA